MSDRFAFSGNKSGFPFLIREVAQDGLPFEVWDGLTTYNGYPSKSDESLIDVYGARSRYNLKLTRFQLAMFYWRVRGLSLTVEGFEGYGAETEGEATSASVSLAAGDVYANSQILHRNIDDDGDTLLTEKSLITEDLQGWLRLADGSEFNPQFDLNAEDFYDFAPFGFGVYGGDAYTENINFESPSGSSTASFSMIAQYGDPFPSVEKIIKVGSEYWVALSLFGDQLVIGGNANSNTSSSAVGNANSSFREILRYRTGWEEFASFPPTVPATETVTIKLVLGGSEMTAEMGLLKYQSVQSTGSHSTGEVSIPQLPTLIFEAVDWWPYATIDGDQLYDPETGKGF
ncbi:MAG: hypothetical protein ACSHX0_06920 [Akkermansiaceae bacterium]